MHSLSHLKDLKHSWSSRQKVWNLFTLTVRRATLLLAVEPCTFLNKLYICTPPWRDDLQGIVGNRGIIRDGRGRWQDHCSRWKRNSGGPKECSGTQYEFHFFAESSCRQQRFHVDWNLIIKAVDDQQLSLQLKLDPEPPGVMLLSTTEGSEMFRENRRSLEVVQRIQSSELRLEHLSFSLSATKRYSHPVSPGTLPDSD